ncbi:hypothetical protein QQS21_005507 [Conoideocrella luteorostrata]|uniref:Amidohydrolase-related domain-containing protein n=1 Tax=Conoideocrella luteorostrata TaxID=1105319 RepID=A0AAJ0CPB9_9HYPO|nr:hypothetical protein QQS21_005507 [Conoideocrella luteorostrata]
MRSAFMAAFVVVLYLSAFAVGCPFHTPQETNVTTNNERRSTPQTCVKTAIKDVRVFDGIKFTPPQTVCIDAGYIIEAQSCADAAVTVNATGKFLIPGLIDSHVHLTDVRSLENYTSYGCTSAMQMNCGNYTQCDIMAHQPGLASFYRAGRSAVGKNSSHEKQDPARPKDTLIYPTTNVTEFTQWQFGNGSDYMKITAEVNGPSTQQQIEMVKTAHCQYHKQTMTHASSVYAYQQAVESVTDGIQHVPDDGILSDAIIRQIKKQGQFVTPTLNVFKYSYGNAALQRFFSVIPGSNRTLGHAEVNARRLYEGGVPLIAGTDAVGTRSIPGGAFVDMPFGLTLHFELQNLVDVVGMSPAEAINAATRDAAKWHRLYDTGSVEVGKRADLLLLHSNPLLNISNTLDIDKVWALGSKVSYVQKSSITAQNP